MITPSSWDAKHLKEFHGYLSGQLYMYPLRECHMLTAEGSQFVIQLRPVLGFECLGINNVVVSRETCPLI